MPEVFKNMSGRYLFLILGILAFVFFAGCVSFEASKAPVDAVAVWQHQEENNWDIWYSLYDHTGKVWHVPAGGQTAPVIVDEGDDHDPDVSSYGETAVAVWSKEKDGSRDIYGAKWHNYAWTVPSAVSTSGKDTDPTVALNDAGDAITVWVHDGKELHYSLYSGSSDRWTSPKKINTTGIEKISLPELTYSEYWGTYFLVFTGLSEDGSQYSYEMFYWNGWEGPWWIDYDAVLDNNEPTNQRTGITADWNSGYVTYVWPVTDGTLESYSYKYDFVNYMFHLYGEKQMPDTAYDANDVAHGVQTKNDNLYHQPDVNSPGTEVVIASPATPDYRNSLTFILERTVGLTVWWNKEDGPGEIYYSYLENNIWSTAQPIQANFLKGYDRNPAVTPIVKLEIEEEPMPFCGDGTLQFGEQCEVGIPCPNPNDLCWIDCQCYQFEYPYCGDGVLDAGEQCEVGIPCPNPNDLCWIDCQCYPWPRPPPKPPEEEPPPIPPEEPEEEEEEPEEPATVSCNGNSDLIETQGINTFDPSRQVCSDDCAEDYICDAHSCNCLPATAVITPRCGDGYISTPEVPGGGREECDTGSASSPKPDTCPYPEVCVNCECVAPGEYVSCGGNTYGVDRTDLNRFNPDTMECTDDCSLYYGENYECNAESCTCTPKAPPEQEEEPVCGNGEIESGEQCENDAHCAQGYECVGCECVMEGEQVTDPVCGDGVITPPEQCEDASDCPAGAEYECIGCMCYYYEVTQECGNEVREGSEECDGSDAEACSPYGVCSEGCTCVYKPSLDCADVCGEMGLPIILGHGYPDAEACSLAAEEPEEECFTKCIKAGYYRVDNIAGWDSCCCKKVETFPCEDCPGVDPYCPECPEEYQE